MKKILVLVVFMFLFLSCDSDNPENDTDAVENDESVDKGVNDADTASESDENETPDNNSSDLDC